MGLGDFLGSVGEALGGDWVVDQAQKAPDAARNAWHASEALGKGAAYLGNPTHWDDVAKGAVNAAQFVGKHPGQTWDTGFEVGRAMLKDQLDPVNLAINAGLLAATVATGGAAAPALLGKIGMGIKSAKVGLEAVEAGEGVAEGLRAAKTAHTAFKAVRATEEAAGALKAGEAALDVGRAVDKGTEAVKDVGRFDHFLAGQNAAGEAKLLPKIMNPISRPVENLMQGARDWGATKILAGGGEEAGFARQTAAAIVQGNTGNMPTQLARQSENFAKLQKTMWRGRQVASKTVGYAQTAAKVQTAYDITANPVGYAKGKGEEAWSEHGAEVMEQATPYVSQVQNQAQDVFKARDKPAEPQQPFEPLTAPDMTQAIGLQQFRLDRTHATVTSQRQPNRAAQLGTVTTNTTMPAHIGPSDWYGPSSGYDAGRGFQQRPAQPTTGLAPLTQPTRDMDMVGI